MSTTKQVEVKDRHYIVSISADGEAECVERKTPDGKAQVWANYYYTRPSKIISRAIKLSGASIPSRPRPHPEDACLYIIAMQQATKLD